MKSIKENKRKKTFENNIFKKQKELDNEYQHKKRDIY